MPARKISSSETGATTMAISTKDGLERWRRQALKQVDGVLRARFEAEPGEQELPEAADGEDERQGDEERAGAGAQHSARRGRRPRLGFAPQAAEQPDPEEQPPLEGAREPQLLHQGRRRMEAKAERQEARHHDGAGERADQGEQ